MSEIGLLLEFVKRLWAGNNDSVHMTLLAKAHKYYSLYIRQSQADFLGLVECCTCNHIAPWKQMHLGHYIDRRYLRVAFDHRNTGVQCPTCNCKKDGNITEFEKHIIRTNGDVIEELHNLKHNGPIPDLTETYLKYKELVAQLP